MELTHKQVYHLINEELKFWNKEFEDENSLANLYGLQLEDAIFSIIGKVLEMERKLNGQV